MYATRGYPIDHVLAEMCREQRNAARARRRRAIVRANRDRAARDALAGDDLCA